MTIPKQPAAMRFFLLVVGTTIWVGIWHTGFDVASWVLYIPAVFLLFAAVSGVCPGIILSRMLFKEK